MTAFASKTYLTVRYAETDMMGIVHHSRYYPWFEMGRTDFIKQTGISYIYMEKTLGILLPLTETHAKYIRGLKYEDEVMIETRISALGAAKISFAYRVFLLPDMILSAEGSTVHGFVNTDFKPINMKKKFPELWEKFNALQ